MGGSKNHAQSSIPGFLPILRSHSRNLITILKISFFTKMHSPDCRNFTGPAYSASTQCKPPLARKQNVIRMTFSWRADVRVGGGGVLWYFHTYVGSGYFWGFKILNFNIFWVFRRMKIVWGMKIVWLFFFWGGGGPHKNGLVWEYFLCILGSFLRSSYRFGILFGVAKISNMFLGCLKFLIFLGVNGKCWVRAYAWGKN